jgi:hypothetical protein
MTASIAGGIEVYADRVACRECEQHAALTQSVGVVAEPTTCDMFYKKLLSHERHNASPIPVTILFTKYCATRTLAGTARRSGSSEDFAVKSRPGSIAQQSQSARVGAQKISQFELEAR